ncbi:cyclic nucleotide-binding domain-containing protein [bacterium]|nr:cyclic nucleotide-binding domain-containing protein [bacterium]
MKSVDRKLLGLFSLFKGLSAQELDLVSRIITAKDVSPGTVIISEGEIGDEMYLLAEGTVDIHKTLTVVTSKQEFGTKERTFIRLSGENHLFFGELALFGGRERSATVQAANKCNLLVIKADDFLKLCENEPRIGYVVITNIALNLATNLRKTNEDVIKLTTALSLALQG